MHEFGMCEAIVDAVERRADGRRVAAVGVRVGTLHRVVPDAFRQAFEAAATGTVADGASVELSTERVRGRCLDCEETFATDEGIAACPACGSITVATEGGDELVLEWLRYHEAAPRVDA